MKWLIRILVPVIVLAACIFGDVKLASWLFSHLPADASWLFWAKFGISFGIFWMTFGIITLVVIFTGTIVAALTES